MLSPRVVIGPRRLAALCGRRADRFLARSRGRERGLTGKSAARCFRLHSGDNKETRSAGERSLLWAKMNIVGKC